MLTSIVIEFVEGHAGTACADRRQLAAARSRGLVARNRRRYGGYVVHAAIVLLAIGVAGSSVYQTTREAKLSPGQSMEAAGYTLVVPRRSRPRRGRITRPCGPTSISIATASSSARLEPGKNRYAAEQQVSNEMAIHTNWLRAEDVDVIADQVNPDGSVYFKVLVKPLVNLIWLAGFVFLVGSVITLWPDARESRRLAERYERAGHGEGMSASTLALLLGALLAAACVVYVARPFLREPAVAAADDRLERAR